MENNNLLIKKLCNDMKVHNATIVIGAGASYEAGMPLSGQLASIVWAVIDEFPIIKIDLGYEKDVPAKQIVGENFDALKNAFDLIEQIPDATVRFKEIFKKVNDKHKYIDSVVHETLCRLIHSGYVSIVVSFNWDNLLETAWKRLYGTNINDNRDILIKPHGDVENIDAEWTLPNCDGRLDDEIMDYIRMVLDDIPTTFVVMGYSETDDYILENLIKPNDDKYPSYRISPSAKDSIALTASKALTEIESILCVSDNKPWSRIDYTNHAGIENAIMGYRLQPVDTLSCPKLPNYKDAEFVLDQHHYVIIEGDPGCGKSITAYQLGYHFLQDGYEIVKLDNRRVSDYPLHKIINNGYKTVYILDDAQQVELTTINELRGIANKENKLIITQTCTQEFPDERIRIIAKTSVDTLYHYYLEEKKTILPIVSRINKRNQRYIGERYMDTPYELLLESAHNEKTPWLFNYVLRGGWKNTSTQFHIAMNKENVEVLLTLIAFKQIVNLDRTVDISWLYEKAKLWNCDASWCDSSLKFLKNEKIILNNEEVRTPHLEAAIRIIVCFFEIEDEKKSDSMSQLFINEMLEKNTPLQGILWFFNLLFGFEKKYKITHCFMNTDFYQSLLKRCMRNLEIDSIDYAPYILDNIITRYGSLTYSNVIENYEGIIRNWIENVNKNSAYSLSRVLNGMINDSDINKMNWVKSLDLTKLYIELARINPEDTYVWAEFLNRLIHSQDQQWLSKFYKNLPIQEIRKSILDAGCNNISGSMELMFVILFVDEQIGHEIFAESLHKLEKCMKINFLKVLQDLGFHFLIYICGKDLFGDRKPTRIQKESSKAFTACITVEMITSVIENGTARDWETVFNFAYLVHKYDPEKYTEAIRNIDLEKLDESSEDLWLKQDRELMLLMHLLISGKKKELENWVLSKFEKMEHITPTFIYISPGLVTEALNTNKKVLIISDNNHYWQLSAMALNKLKKYNKSVCILVLNRNKDKIKKSVLELASIDWKEYHIFIKVLVQTNSYFFSEIISEISLETLEVNYMRKLSNSHGESYSNDGDSLKGFMKYLTILKKFDNNYIVDRIIAQVKEKLTML